MTNATIQGVSALVDTLHDEAITELEAFRQKTKLDYTLCESYKSAKLLDDIVNLFNDYYGLERMPLEEIMSVIDDVERGEQDAETRVKREA